MKIILIPVLFLFVVIKASAQGDGANENVTIIKDPRINTLVQKNREINEEIYLKTIKNMSGYRLQVINTNDRNKAIAVKTRMLSDFPKENTYLIYHAPYFKIQMGNFRTREEAEELMKKVKRIYPSGVFIVPSPVEIKPTKDGELIL